MSDESNLTPLLCVGDKVKIVKPDDTNNEHCFRWIHQMDKFNGQEACVVKVITKPEDEDINSYDLDIDDGEFGWLHTYLQPI